MTASTSTKAETRARALAGRLEQAGFSVKVTVERTAAEFFSSGETMLPARVFVSVSARGQNYWDNRYSFTFSTSLPARGHRATTQFVGGHQYRGLPTRRRKPGRKLTLKELWLYAGIELDNARYRAERDSLAPEPQQAREG